MHTKDPKTMIHLTVDLLSFRSSLYPSGSQPEVDPPGYPGLTAQVTKNSSAYWLASADNDSLWHGVFRSDVERCPGLKV